MFERIDEQEKYRQARVSLPKKGKVAINPYQAYIKYLREEKNTDQKQVCH
jgi:hypothetical protein